MTRQITRDARQMVDSETGLVDRRIFADRDIYELELERIFARAWNFMAHDSQIPSPGDFFMTYIGEDRVICVRDENGDPQILVNSCRHRGNAVCRAEEGHATSFMCTYHGWTYDLKGDLVGVPGFKEVYHEELDRDSWGLIKAAQVASYKGFIFACMDADAPGLDDYLGEVGRVCIDMLAVRGELQVFGGVQKFTVDCNWKFAADNVWDWYHLFLSHASASMIGAPVGAPPPGQGSADWLAEPHLVFLGEYGHALAGSVAEPASPAKKSEKRKSFRSWRDSPEAKEALGAAIRSQGSSHIFPNFWLTHFQVCLRVPKGPHRTEIWWFSFWDKTLSKKANAAILRRLQTVFGPAGMAEQEDGENWAGGSQNVRGVVSRRYPLNYAMGLGHGEIIEDELDQPRIETRVNEHAQLWLYRSWSEWMDSESWHDLKANHSPSPRGVV